MKYKIIILLILTICLTGCVTNTKYVDSFCLWATPITLTKHEVATMSIESLRQIDVFNTVYETRCVAKYEDLD